MHKITDRLVRAAWSDIKRADWCAVEASVHHSLEYVEQAPSSTPVKQPPDRRVLDPQNEILLLMIAFKLRPWDPQVIDEYLSALISAGDYSAAGVALMLAKYFCPENGSLKAHDDAIKIAFGTCVPKNSNPSSPGYISYLADIGKSGNAVKILHEQLKATPNCADSMRQLAQLYLAGNKIQEAKSFARQLSELAPDDIATKLTQIRILLKSHRYDAALDLAETVSSSKSSSPDALVVLGACYRLAGSFDKAEMIINSALSISATHAEARANLALIYLAEGKIDRARLQLELLLFRRPGLLEIWDLIKQALIKTRHYDGLLKAVAIMLWHSPGNSNLLQLLTKCLEYEASSETKTRVLESIERSGNADTATKINLAKLYFDNRETKRATGALEDISLEDIPDGALLAATNLYSDMGNIKFATKLINSRDHLFSNNVPLLNLAAILNFRMGNLKLADQVVRELVVIPDLPAGVLNNAANVLSDLGDHVEADKQIKRALDLEPSNPNLYNTLGIINRRAGNTKDAIKSFDSALHFFPDLQSALDNKGESLCELREYESAIGIFERSRSRYSQARIIECLLQIDERREVATRLDDLAKGDPTNIRAAAFSSFFSYSARKTDLYPFCPEPSKYLFHRNIGHILESRNNFYSDLMAELDLLDMFWQPYGKSTVSGRQTAPIVFEQEGPTLVYLKSVLINQLLNYRKLHRAETNLLFSLWPKSSKLEGWYVELLKGGYQSSHIHPNGWVSGVFYIETIQDDLDSSGAIEFGSIGYDYPAAFSDSPTITISPRNGDLILFPSSLFHRTIPFAAAKARKVIAFDIVPR